MVLAKGRSAGRGRSAARLALLCVGVACAWHMFVRDGWGAVQAGAGVRLAFGDGSADDWHSGSEKARVMARLRAVLRVCGGLCDTRRRVRGDPRDGLHFGVSEAAVPCRGLYASEEVDVVRETAVPPKEIPEELVEYFTMGGRVSVRGQYHDQKYLGKKERVLQWDTALIEGMIAEAKNGSLRGTYGPPKTRRVLAMLREHDVRGMRVLVVGSEAPWAEACALAAGAREVVTLEYGLVNATHPRVSAMLPRDFAAAYLSGALEEFDLVIAFSSLEHPGLGRYGDALNPWGDIIAVAKAWCVTKPGGAFLMEVPYGPDEVVFNAHRVYGRVRAPYQMTNWRQVSQSKKVDDARMYVRLDAPIV